MASISPYSPSTFKLNAQQELVIPSKVKVHDKIHLFMVESNMLFYQPIKDPDTWHHLPLPDNCEALEVKTDYEGLYVMDTRRVVHFTKSVEKTENGYRSLLEKPVWWKGAFNLPVISWIYNRIVAQPKLVLPEGALWAGSFLEEGTFYIDGAKKEHMLGKGSITPTDTLYLSDQDSRVFFYYDPYIPKEAFDYRALSIPFPESPNSTFDLVHFVSARSALFMIGYDITKNQKDGVDRTLVMYYTQSDANLQGMNVLEIGYRYSENSEKFRLPAVKYEKLTLPSDSISSNIGIERDTGNSMRDLILTVEGNQEGIRGIFTKKLNEDIWNFTPVSINPSEILNPRETDEKRSFSTSVHDYTGKSELGDYDVELTNFGRNSLHSHIKIAANGNVYECDLFKKQSQWNLAAYNCTDYTLVSPLFTQAVLEVDEVTDVSVDQSDESLVIKHGNKTLIKLQKN